MFTSELCMTTTSKLESVSHDSSVFLCACCFLIIQLSFPLVKEHKTLTFIIINDVSAFIYTVFAIH